MIRRAGSFGQQKQVLTAEKRILEGAYGKTNTFPDSPKNMNTT